MSAHGFRPVTPHQAGKLERSLLATKLFTGAEDLHAVLAERPWAVQVNGRGDVAVLARWRDHLPYLSIEALWCPLPEVPQALRDCLGIAREHGMTDVVSPPTRVEEMRVFESAGMRPEVTVVTLVRETDGVVEGADPARAGITFRHLGHLDIPAILELDMRCFEPFWAYDAHHLARFCTTGRLVAALRADVMLGYTLTTVDGGDGLLGRLCVAPEVRRQGIGLALVADAVEFVRSQGGEHITLSTQIGNAPSQALYAKAGFRDNGRRYVFLRFGFDEG